MIYWFTGQPSAGKTTLGTKLHRFLKTEKRNWRRDVFHIDGDNLRELTINKDYTDKGRETNIRNAQMMAEYLHGNGCDVVVSLVSPIPESNVNVGPTSSTNSIEKAGIINEPLLPEASVTDTVLPV